jgi:hypothetical protein
MHFRELWSDMRLLFAAELPKSATVPPRESFADDEVRSAAEQELKRRYRLAVLQQAFEKQRIRETLWPRFCRGLLLAAPITYPFSLLFPTIWATGILANHQILEWLALNFCTYRIESWFNHSRRSTRSPPDTKCPVSFHAAHTHRSDHKGRPVIEYLSPFGPKSLDSASSDEDRDALYAEVVRCRSSWRRRHYFRILLVLGVVAWTLWLMPYAVRHRSPFGE